MTLPDHVEILKIIWNFKFSSTLISNIVLSREKKLEPDPL